MHSEYENSLDQGHPVDLFDFRLGAFSWRYCNAEVAVTVGGESYEPLQISSTDRTDGAEVNKRSVTVQVPRINAVADLFRVQPPGTVLSVTIRELQLNDPDQQLAVRWIGRVLNCEWAGPVAKLYAESVSTSIKRPGLRRGYALGCPHTLYDQSPGSCRVNKESYRTNGVVSGVSGATIEVPALAGATAGYYDGGFVYWNVSDGRYDFRTIDTQVGGTLHLLFPVQGLTAGDAVAVYPGCNRTLAVCADKFGNHLNYGGLPNTPGTNPFNGTKIF